MRLDRYLVEKGYATGREAAKRLIEASEVLVDGKVAKKPSLDVIDEALVEVTATPPRYVGRGGEKLAGALALFSLSPAGLSALDIGASTGGFTDCLLQHGAKSVVAIDAGVGQLHPSLLADPRVTNIEKYNARDLSFDAVGVHDLAVMDVSFISQTLILPRIPLVVKQGGKLVSLIKPQFEAGRGALNKKGIVTDPRYRILAVTRVLESAAAAGLYCLGLAPSPILGGDGNEEFLALFEVREGALDNTHISIEKTVVKKEVTF